MYKVYSKSSCYKAGSKYFANTFFGGDYYVPAEKTLHVASTCRFPQAAALKLPTNVVDINAAEMGRFSPLRERDISGPVINSSYGRQQQAFPKIDITVQADPHVNKYDCRGAVNLSSSMQSNVPSPFSGNHTHLGMPGSQWGQGYKYLSDHLHSAHYLTLRNEYRDRVYHTIVLIGTRSMSTSSSPQNSKTKLKNAIKEYGSTVIVVHVGLSLMSLGGFYLLVSSGYNVVELLKYLNLEVASISKIMSSNAGNFIVAYAIHKVFAPLRIAVTLTATPFIVRYLRQTGMLKGNIIKKCDGVGKLGNKTE